MMRIALITLNVCIICQAVAVAFSNMIDNPNKMPTSLSDESLPIQSLVQKANKLYCDTFGDDGNGNGNGNGNDNGNDNGNRNNEILCTVAPGRVNLIGEHTDYTGGFVFPMAIEFSTVCVGKGSIVRNSNSNAVSVSKVISANAKGSRVISFDSSSVEMMTPLSRQDTDSWSNYVAGVVQQYMKELSKCGCSISLEIAICGDVPLGSGLSSSASLEVAVATFIEKVIEKSNSDLNLNLNLKLGGMKETALRCQAAENEFCGAPCGIMDQYVSVTANKGSAIMIDCRSLEYQTISMGDTDTTSNPSDVDDGKPVFLICNSNVKHSIGGGEYPIRVTQCADATKHFRSIHGDGVVSLRDVSLAMVAAATKKGSSSSTDDADDDADVTLRRAKHVVAENERTQKAALALANGNWAAFGKLMNESHESMKTDYEVSCEEIDILADLAQNFEGVYGSRLTGGGFGGCTITLVDRRRVKELCDFLKEEYSVRTGGKECLCYEASPGAGAREIIINM